MATRQPTKLEMLDSSAFASTQGLVANTALVPAKREMKRDWVHPTAPTTEELVPGEMSGDN